MVQDWQLTHFIVLELLLIVVKEYFRGERDQEKERKHEERKEWRKLAVGETGMRLRAC